MDAQEHKTSHEHQGHHEHDLELGHEVAADDLPDVLLYKSRIPLHRPRHHFLYPLDDHIMLRQEQIGGQKDHNGMDQHIRQGPGHSSSGRGRQVLEKAADVRSQLLDDLAEGVLHLRRPGT